MLLFLWHAVVKSALIVCLLMSLIGPTMCMVGSSTAIAMELSLGDVAVIGCGVLGTSVCRQLIQQQQQQQQQQQSIHFTSITGITKTTSHHEEIRQKVLGRLANGQSHKFTLSTIDDIRQNGKKFNNVIYCAPPSGSMDYAKDVGECITTMWNRNSIQNSKFVFTSSGAVYGNTAKVVNEASPIDKCNRRAMRLIPAEDTCLMNSGTVLRLAKLYNLELGAHSFWLKKFEDVMRRPDGIINLLHYDDAASACVAALTTSNDDACGKVFLISDGNPMTREEICRTALQHYMYSSTCCMPKFIFNENEPIGKIYDGSWSENVLQWKPNYKSFPYFCNVSTPEEGRQEN